MAEFLTTQGTSYCLENIIINANTWLILISPYLNISGNFLQRLQDADKKKVRICIVYGKDELKPEEKTKLQKLENLSLRYYKNLHAKCYLNENTMIITSMNMHEFSEKTNREMGILIHKDTDQKIYEDAMKEVDSILGSASEDNISIHSETQSEEYAAKSGSRHGYCIRCGQEIPYDTDKPYCQKCFYEWSEKVKNYLHKEMYCHTCGVVKEKIICKQYPQCRTCARQYPR